MFCYRLCVAVIFPGACFMQMQVLHHMPITAADVLIRGCVMTHAK